MTRVWRDYLELTKPRLTALVAATAAFGHVLGRPPEGPAASLLQTLLGVALVAGGAGALNMVMERRLDARMGRTRNRPLPAGRVSPGAAFLFGGLASLAGILHLAYHCNPVTALLSLLALAVYLAAYTPLKIRTPLNTWVGGITGALPPLMGWTASTGGSLAAPAWTLFAILFVWQMPHFFALACLYREDYIKAGFKMLGTLPQQGRLAEGQILLWSLALVPVSLLPMRAGLAGGIYGASALALGALFLPLALRLYITRSPQDGQRVFLASLAYLPLLFGVMIFDRNLGAL